MSQPALRDETRRSLLRRLAARPWLCVGLPALLAFVLAALPTLVAGPPGPVAHDEWGYLLSADTFAAGRATNATHPFWVHFESVHQFHTPSYQSKYPPAQALFLALGQVLWHPILGVWISVALLVGALVWMLLAWMPPRWALVGGLLAVALYVLQGEPYPGGTQAYWSQSYWGGAVAATGGALLFGALARSVARPQVSSSVLLALGLLVLANSRPLEGLIVGLPAAVYLLVWMLSARSPGWAILLRRLVLPVLLVLGSGLLAMGAYNQAVSGDPLELPWITHYRQYCVFRTLVWQEPAPDRDWRHASLRAFYGGYELAFSERYHDLRSYLTLSLKKLANWIFFVGPVLAVLLLYVPAILRRGWMRFLAVPIVLILINGMLSFSVLPHYSAPAAGPTLAFLVEGLRRARAGRRHPGGVGRKFYALLLVALVVAAGLGLKRATDGVAASQATRRNRFERRFEEQPGEHLVLVTYAPGHAPEDAWIFNRADIDAARVIWARDMGEEGNRALLEAFPQRHVWRLTVAGRGQPVEVEELR